MINAVVKSLRQLIDTPAMKVQRIIDAEYIADKELVLLIERDFCVIAFVREYGFCLLRVL